MRGIFGKLLPSRGGASAGEAVLRAFGKLPVSREFIHVEDGEGAARAFAEWLGAGHDAWIAAHGDGTRGELLPSRLLMCLPRYESTWIVASVWPSRDQAPRHFPFALYVVIPAANLPAEPLARWLSCLPVWERMEPIFPDLQRADLETVQTTLRDQRISFGALELKQSFARVEAEAAQIQLSDWLAAVLGAEAARDPVEWLWWLQKLADGWRGEGPQHVPLAVRCPLSPAFSLSAQIGAWLRWFDVQLRAASARGGGSALLTRAGLIVPSPGVAERTAGLGLLENPLRPGDFELLTSDAARYKGAEELSQSSGEPAREGFDAFAERMRRELPVTSARLREWAETRL